MRLGAMRLGAMGLGAMSPGSTGLVSTRLVSPLELRPQDSNLDCTAPKAGVLPLHQGGPRRLSAAVEHSGVNGGAKCMAGECAGSFAHGVHAQPAHLGAQGARNMRGEHHSG